MSIVQCSIADVLPLFEAHHGYASLGNVATYCWGWEERGRIVAAWVWNPPAPGAAKALGGSEPQGVLALSRMVAVDRADRELRHISKPLRVQMRRLIDRGRWPTLVTWSDASLGHTGHVYKCSGWQREATTSADIYEDDKGRRRSRYSGGGGVGHTLRYVGKTEITRWTHRAAPLGGEADWMTAAGWCRRAIPGKVWKSGSQAFAICKVTP